MVYWHIKEDRYLQVLIQSCSCILSTYQSINILARRTAQDQNRIAPLLTRSAASQRLNSHSRAELQALSIGNVLVDYASPH